MPRFPALLAYSAVIGALLVPAFAGAQVIDFETLPGGAPTTDLQPISNEYASLGVTFALLDRDTGAVIGSPRIAKAGAPQTAFEGCSAPDTPYGYLGLGQSCLTDGTGLGVQGDVRISYAAGVSQASGVILDVDCRTNGGPPCEQWTITAYDAAGSVLDEMVIDAPVGPAQPQCTTPGAGPGDSEAFGWTLTAPAASIRSIVLRYTGTADAAGVGLAFDSFSVDGPPGPLEATATAPVDTVCAGDAIILQAFPAGGLPPYAYQWQRDDGGWTDLGTAAAQEVQPGASASYRVVVTDTDGGMATSAPVTVTVDAGGLLCSASLLVACNSNNSVVRAGFRTGGGEVLVPPGSGGLSSTSDIVVGPDGNLYVTSQANNRILRYDAETGAFLDTFIAAGSGGLDVPVGLDFGPDGNLYVVSNGNHSVLRYDGTTGAFVDVFVPNGSGLNTPTGLAFGPGGDLYVCSRNSDKVLRFDGATGAPLGDFVASGSGGLAQPRGLRFGPDGNLYIAEELHDSVRRYDGGTGAFLDVFVASGSGGLDRANDLAFGPDGTLWVASFNNDRVLAYDGADGAFLGELDDTLLHGPAWVETVPRVAPTGVAASFGSHLRLSVELPRPNPTGGYTTVAFTLPAAGHARVDIVDVSGRRVATVLDRMLGAGSHRVGWDGLEDGGRGVAGGVYFVRVESGGEGVTRKIVRIH
jgi:DNA-binding beta-propeller fold protein YncE